MEDLPVVLVLEDDPNILKLLLYVLKKFPVRLAQSSSVAEAHAVVEREPVAMAFLDYMLPDGLSSGLIKHIKAHGLARVVMLTARGEASVKEECFGNGCDDYILKPFSLKQIESSMQALLGT